MDKADKTQENAELYLSTALYKSRRHEPDIVPIGQCLFCGDPVAEQRRWCDADCRDEWERANV